MNNLQEKVTICNDAGNRGSNNAFIDQHIVITGGSSGLGFELARQLILMGARLTLLARDTVKLASAAEKLQYLHPSAQVVTEAVDVCDEVAVTNVMQCIAETAGGIDMLINSAGILREGYFEQLSTQSFRDVMEINLFGIIHAIHAALPYLKKSQGRLVNIASMAGLTGVFGYTPYCSAKYALVGFTEALRYELHPLGISVSLACPGEFNSPMVDELDRNRTAENRAHTLMIPKVSVDTIAREILSGILKNRFLIIPGQKARWAAFGIRHFPGIIRAVGDQKVAQTRRNSRD